jgi:hypothetical protein
MVPFRKADSLAVGGKRFISVSKYLKAMAGAPRRSFCRFDGAAAKATCGIIWHDWFLVRNGRKSPGCWQAQGFFLRLLH